MKQKNIILITGVILISLTSCLEDMLFIRGNGISETVTRRSGTFSRIENSTSIDIVYKKADTTGITITADENLLSYIETETYSFTALLTGSGNMNIKDCQSTGSDIFLSGSGNLNLKGQCIESDMKITGSGELFAEDFLLKSASVILSGSGNVFTSVENDLNGVISGSGNIYLKGDPIINKTITGSGRIIKL